MISSPGVRRRALLVAIPVTLLFAEAQATQRSPAPTLTAEAIVERLVEANRQRDRKLAGYRVSRRYHLKNELSEKDTILEVDVTFLAPAEMKFDIRSQQGSTTITRRVFGRMMEGEQESLQPEQKRRSAVTLENYSVRLLGQESLQGRPAYKLEITPKREDTFLFAGTVWVDAQDFAVVRATGSPIKRPSFWTRKTDFVRTFKKVGPFWLPERTDSVSEVMLFGTSWVSIENRDYRVRVRADAAGQ